MSTTKTIYVIRVEDAAQYHGKLKAILENLKQEKRISGYREIDAATVDSSTLNAI